MVRERANRTMWLLATCFSGLICALGLPGAASAQTRDADKAAGNQVRTGQAVYDAVCAACHAAGVLNAPKLGDSKAWAPLIREGQKALTRAAIKGIRQMPAKGGNPALSNLEVERAVVHMANAAGGKFKEPR
jgi:cytochrome c5